MLKKDRKGMPARVCTRIRNAAMDSAMIGFFCNYSRVNHSFQNGSFGGTGSVESRAFVRRACLHARDRSVFLFVARRIGDLFLRGSLRSYGLFLILSSLFCILVRLAIGAFSIADVGLIVCVALIAASVFLLHARQSLSYAIEKSVFLSWLFFSVCRFPQDRFAIGEIHGRDRPWITLSISVPIGLLASIVQPMYLILFALATCIFLLAVAVPELIFLIAIFLFPFLNLLPHTTLLLTGLVLTGDILWLCKALCGHRDYQFGVLQFFLLLFGAFLFLGGVFGAGGFPSFERAGLMTVLLMSYFPLASICSQKVWRRRILLMLCLSAFAVSFFGIGQYFFGDLELKWVDVARFSDIGGRVTSFFSNPNVLAVYLILTFPLLLGESTYNELSPRLRFFFLITVLLELACLIFTWSRGGWLGAIASALVFMLLCSKKSMKILFLSIIPMIVWLPFLPHNVVNRFASIGMLNESSIRYRFYTWQGVARMLYAHPFGIGVGEEAFFTVYQGFALSGIETVMHTHNLFLQIAVELGIMGLICFLVVLFFFFQSVFECLHVCRRLNFSRLTLGGLCSVVGVLVMGFFDHVWYHYGLFWLFWIVIALTSGTVQEKMQYFDEGRRLFL